MTKEEIAKVLKDSRIKAGFEAKEVAERMMELGAIKSIKSFYNWESGRTQPDADTFMYLCNLYNVKNVMELFGYDVENNAYQALSTEHHEVLYAYEKADLQHKNFARMALGLELLDNQPEESNLVRFVARGGHVEMTEEEAEEMVRSSRNVPDQSGNKDLF